VKTVRNPADEKSRRFAKEQHAARKDVERAFGVLHSRRAIVQYPARTWSPERMWNVMTDCVIMHNMIMENERTTTYMTKAGIFRVSWLSQWHGWHFGSSSCMPQKICMIVTSMIGFKLI
jgi:hypothetical protein